MLDLKREALHASLLFFRMGYFNTPKALPTFVNAITA